MASDTPAHLLIVDDDPLSRTLMLEVLGDVGYAVDGASDGIKALQRLRARNLRPFDLVVLDMNMPRMDGFTVAREIRSDDRLRELSVLAVTGLDRPEDTLRALQAGCDAYLSKPVGIQDVREVVAGLLEDQEQRTATRLTEPSAPPPRDESLDGSTVRLGVAGSHAQLLAGAGHVMRTRMTSILGFAALLGEFPDLPARQQRQLAHVQQEGEALLALTDDLIDYGRLTTGTYRLRREAIVPTTLVGDLVDRLEPLAARSQVHLAARFDNVPARLQADYWGLRHALTNMVGACIDVAQPEQVVDVSLARDSAVLAVIVRCSDADAGKISDVIANSGLGLAVAGKLIELHNGTLLFEPRSDGAFVLEARLPLA